MHFGLAFIRSAVTVVWFVLFIALWIGAWSRRRRADYADAARLPFEPSDPVDRPGERLL
jgi:cbb3-type cytochrome oxidase subunit 3